MQSGMRNAIIALAAAAAVMLAAPRHARACGQGYGSGFAAAILTVVAVGAIDTGMLLWDAGSVLADHRNSRGYATFEAIWTLPQFVLGAYATMGTLTSYRSSDALAPGIYTAAMGLMAAHAIWTLSTPDCEEQSRIAFGATYVPLGQLSHPGVGLVGRF
jgi:hypothetical protein